MDAEEAKKPAIPLAPMTKAIACALAAVIMMLGVYPKPLQKVLTPAAASVVVK